MAAQRIGKHKATADAGCKGLPGSGALPRRAPRAAPLAASPASIRTMAPRTPSAPAATQAARPTPSAPAGAGVAPAAARRQRLASADRERQIIDGAIAYFSEAGFSGQTRELSMRLGITQPLLYRYFENKQALIERVYQTVFEGRWNPAWIPPLRDRSQPLRERLIGFYQQYSAATYPPDWIRIYMHAGLSDPTLNRRCIRLVRRELLPVFCRELRHACGVDNDSRPVAEEEIEFVWALHGGIFYRAMREHVYRTRIAVDFMPHAALVIDTFLAGAATTYPPLLARLAAASKAPPGRTRAAPQATPSAASANPAVQAPAPSRRKAKPSG